ncbi:hypothetical protein [Kutzneria sp. 744]|uniref:hypothetical protein n=1 Tax=Kutzneria sp. (strain 744) TaxID=345341 RepID=UPI0003EEDCCD|nr:hypothetical protein [Kutzneria sp. 744]EWM11715.1 OmpA/MotB protein [Kutzneria sp. 744]
MELPPYREMPPEVRLRLRSRVLPALAQRGDRRVPYMVAAAVIVVATVAAALLMSPARNGLPPASPISVTPTTDALQRFADCSTPGPGLWLTGAYLLRRNGDGVQLTLEPDTNTLGLCFLAHGHPRPYGWSKMQFQQMPSGGNAYQAVHENGLVYGRVGPAVSAVTVNGVPAVLDTGTFVTEYADDGPITIVIRDAKGAELAEGTLN